MLCAHGHGPMKVDENIQIFHDWTHRFQLISVDDMYISCSLFSLLKSLSGWWFGTFFILNFIMWDVILPIDELIFFRGGRSTTNQFFFANHGFLLLRSA